MAGIGGIHALQDHGYLTYGVEIEPEWAYQHPDTIVADACYLPRSWRRSKFDAVVVSPCYGNRMADHHNAKDLCKTCDGTGRVKEDMGLAGLRWGVCKVCQGEKVSRRNTYRHALGRELSEGSSAGLQWGCVAPGTPVLRGDWRWVPVESLMPGDPIVGFDEEVVSLDPRMRQRGRRWRNGRVEAVEVAERNCVRIEFDDGTDVVCTDDHPWIARGTSGEYARAWGWRLASELMEGDRLGIFMPTWTDDRSYDAGWLAGILDGEGSLAGKHCLTVAQNPGPVLDRITAVLDDKSVKFRVDRDRGTHVVTIQGSVAEKARLLGSVRSERLIGKIDLEGTCMQVHDERRVLRVTGIGPHPIVLMGTTCKTYLANGMGSHNTEYRALHERAWEEATRVVMDHGAFILNVKDHVRDHKRQRVSKWHKDTLIDLGWTLMTERRIPLPGLRHGENRDVRIPYEMVYLFQ